MVDEDCGDTDEGEEVLGFAFVTAGRLKYAGRTGVPHPPPGAVGK
ncbi:hypothetical protein ABZ733_00830 [Streptomyces longwoodensis]